MSTSVNERIQKEASDFLIAASAIERPKKGDVADFMHDMPEKGLNANMRALGEVIGNLQDIAMQGADEELLERLRELCEKRVTDKAGHVKTDPYNPTDALLAVAYPGEDGAGMVEMQQLRDAFKHNGRPIFDEILRIITDIAVNKRLEVEGGLDDMMGESRPRKPKDIKPMGWRSSIQDERPTADDKSIRDSAAEFDKDKPPVDDRDIKKSAEGEKEFRMTDDHRTEYEKTEGQDGGQYMGQLRDETGELKQYYRICKQLKEAYDSTLGTCLEPSGKTPDM